MANAETANCNPNLTIDLGARKRIDALWLKGENLQDYGGRLNRMVTALLDSLFDEWRDCNSPFTDISRYINDRNYWTSCRNLHNGYGIASRVTLIFR